MKPYTIIGGLLIVILNGFISKHFTTHKNPYHYLPPVEQPQIFGLESISTQDDEFGGTLSPDGKLFFFCKKAPTTGRSNIIVICFSEFIDGKWANTPIAPFSGIYRDFNPQFSMDGLRIYFMSTRPITGEKPKPDSDIWYIEKTTTGWSEPRHMGEKINSPYVEYPCSFANNGDMYFSSARNGKSVDIYISRFLKGNYQNPEPLDSTINTPGQELDACISPDGTFLVFTSTGREDMLLPKYGALYPRSDLYITYNDMGKWTPPVRMAEPINSTADDLSPSISRDGKLFFFTSKRNFVSVPMKKKLSHKEFEDQLHSIQNGFGNIYSVSTDYFKK